MLLGTLAESLLGNLLTGGKGMMRAGNGIVRAGDGIVRADEGSKKTSLNIMRMNLDLTVYIQEIIYQKQLKEVHMQ